MPRRKEGIAYPIVANVEMILSTTLYWRTAARIPIGTAKSIVTRSELPMSVIVAGIRSKIASRTGWFVMNE